MMNLKRLTVLLLIMGWFAQGISGQGNDRESRREKFFKAKKSYIEESISFSSDEATKFWSIYDTYHKRRHDAMTQKRKGRNAKTDLSEAQAEDMLDVYIEEKQKEMQRHIEYLREMRLLLGAKRVLQLQKVERSFDKDVLKSLKTKKRKKKEKSKE